MKVPGMDKNDLSVVTSI